MNFWMGFQFFFVGVAWCSPGRLRRMDAGWVMVDRCMVDGLCIHKPVDDGG